MGLAVVRSLSWTRGFAPEADVEEFEQELVDQYPLAVAAAGITKRHVAEDRSVFFEFIRFLGRPVWTAHPRMRTGSWPISARSGRARLTVQHKAWALARFFEFLMLRYQGDIHALTGMCVTSRSTSSTGRRRPTTAARVPPSERGGRGAVRRVASVRCRDARKYLPAARDYLAASLWRRVGLRIKET